MLENGPNVTHRSENAAVEGLQGCCASLVCFRNNLIKGQPRLEGKAITDKKWLCVLQNRRSPWGFVLTLLQGGVRTKCWLIPCAQSTPGIFHVILLILREIVLKFK